MAGVGAAIVEAFECRPVAEIIERLVLASVVFISETAAPASG
jgi:hypothetical protein